MSLISNSVFWFHALIKIFVLFSLLITLKGKISDFLSFPKVVIFNFFDFAFLHKYLKNLSSRLSIIVPFSVIVSIISAFAFAISSIFVKFSIWASPIFVIIPICGWINLVSFLISPALSSCPLQKHHTYRLYLNLIN